LDLSHRLQLLQIVVAIFGLELKSVRRQKDETGGAKRHMLEVLERMSGSEIMQLSVAELSRKFGCSSRHLNRLFHEYFGLSVGALRMEMRLLTAITLLRDPEAKVTNVAAQCGFNHLGLFSTCFRRRFHVSPGEWRKISSELSEPPEDLLSSDANCRLRTIGLCPWCKGGNAASECPVAEEGGKGRLGSGLASELVRAGVKAEGKEQVRRS
jgi:AraC-like DNA-binding protein